MLGFHAFGTFAAHPVLELETSALIVAITAMIPVGVVRSFL